MNILALIVASIFAGIVPMLTWAIFLWWFDRYEKEPLPLLMASFLWGFVPSAVMALIAQLILDIPATALFGQRGLAYELVGASFIAPLTEEAIKGLGVLMVFVFFWREFDSVLDGIIYGGLVGFGFAAVENSLYFAFGSEDAVSFACLVILRAFVFGLNHAFFTSLTGIGFALARYQRNWLLKLLYPGLGLGAAMLAHGLHNAGATFASVNFLGLLFSLVSDYTGILLVFIVILVSLGRESRWIKMYLQEEVALGTLTARQLGTAAAATLRLGAGWSAFFSLDVGRWRRTNRFYQQCAELAFKKHQLVRMGNEGGYRALVERLRQEVTVLSRVV